MATGEGREGEDTSCPGHTETLARLHRQKGVFVVVFK